MWCSFRDVLDHALELFVPYDYVCSSSRPAKNRHRTYPRHVQKLIARKRCLWRHHKRDTTNRAMTARYKEVARECKAAMHDVELRREKRVIDADNPGQFFKYVNSKLNRSPSIGMLKGRSGDNVISDKRQ